NLPLALRTMLTWLVIGPVSRTLSTANGGRAWNTITLPTSFSVSQTWSPSGVAAMFGQNGDSCFTLPTILRSATEVTGVSGVRLEHTYAYLPSGEKIVMPGPLASLTRAFSENFAASSTET